jgi:hypothetical protein
MSALNITEKNCFSNGKLLGDKNFSKLVELCFSTKIFATSVD